ncbi:MAG: hypothetical protein LBR12_04825 [Opitutaceae bacterium]|jgi:hypothetical protein|nr:hypothetical protein [Opitutaceae bacterium]
MRKLLLARICLCVACLLVSRAGAATTYTTNGASTDFEADTWGGPLVADMVSGDTMNIRAGNAIILDNATASYTGGTFNVGNTPGDGSFGTFTLNSGTYTTSAGINLGGSGAYGVVNVNGGRLEAGTTFYVGASSSAEGSSLVVDGGKVESGGLFAINYSGGNASVRLESGNLTVGGEFRIGNVNGTRGTFTMNGGNVKATTSITLAANTGANNDTSGYAYINGGVVETARLIVGSSAAGATGTGYLRVGPGAAIIINGSQSNELRATGTIEFKLGAASTAENYKGITITNTGSNPFGVAAGAKIMADLSDFQGTIAGDTVFTLLELDASTAAVGTAQKTNATDALQAVAAAQYTDGAFQYDYTGALSWASDWKSLTLTVHTTVTPIPEPAATAVLLGFLVLAVFWVHRKGAKDPIR